jgi:hypothetical protein
VIHKKEKSKKEENKKARKEKKSGRSAAENKCKRRANFSRSIFH